MHMSTETYDFSQHPRYPGVITRFEQDQNAYGIIRDVEEDLVSQLTEQYGDRAKAKEAGQQFRRACFEMGSFAQLVAFCEYTVERLP
jgi:hypothetical protein